MKKNIFFLTLFSCVYLILSFALYKNVSHENPHRDIDSVNYEKKADKFTKNFNWSPTASEQSSLVQQPNGYPKFMALVYKAFGKRDAPPTGGFNPPTGEFNSLIWIQILLTLLSSFLLFFATKHIFGNTVALLAHGLFCINLGYLVFAQFILAEALLTFFLLLFLERFFCFLKTGNKNPLGLAGFFLGTSIFIKPAALYFIIPLTAVFFIFYQKSHAKKLLLTLILVAGFFLPMFLFQTTGRSLGDYNLYVWFWSKAETDQQVFTNATERNEVFTKAIQEREALITGDPQNSKNWCELKKQFWGAVFKNPALFIKTWVKEMAKTFLGLFTSNLKVLVEPTTKGGDVSFFFTQGSVFDRVHQYITRGSEKLWVHVVGYLEFIFSILKYLFALLALIWLFVRKKWFLLFFFMSYIFYFSLVTGFDGCARYRIMFEFVLLLLTALGIKIMQVRDKNSVTLLL